MAEFKGPGLHEKVFKLINTHITEGIQACDKGEDAVALGHFINATRKFHILFQGGRHKFTTGEKGVEYLDSLFDSFTTLTNNLNVLAREGKGFFVKQVVDRGKSVDEREEHGNSIENPKLVFKDVSRPVSKVADEWHEKCFNVGMQFLGDAVENSPSNDRLWNLKCQLYDNVLAQLVWNKSSRANQVYAQGIRACNKAMGEVPEEAHTFLNSKLALHDSMGRRSFFVNNTKPVGGLSVEGLGDFEDLQLDDSKPVNQIWGEFKEAHRFLSKGKRDISRVCGKDKFWALGFKATHLRDMNNLFGILDRNFLIRAKRNKGVLNEIMSLHGLLRKSIDKSIKLAKSIPLNDAYSEDKNSYLERLLDAKQEALIFAYDTLGDLSVEPELESVGRELRLLRASRVGHLPAFEVDFGASHPGLVDEDLHVQRELPDDLQ